MLRTRLRFLWLSFAVVCGIGAAGTTPLTQAVRDGDVKAATAILRQHAAEANRPESDGTTALHWAVNRDDVAMVDLLLKAGADANATNRYDVAPLSLAAVNGSAVVIEKLLAAGADANTRKPSGETVLMTAARSGGQNAVKVLLAHGADVNATEERREQTALMWAAAENHAAVIKTLIEAGADKSARTRQTGQLSQQEPGERPFTAYLFAVQAGAKDAVAALLDSGVDISETLPDGTGALVIAIANAEFDMASFLLDRGADPNASKQGWTALHQLIWNRRANQGNNQVFPVPRGQVDSMTLVKQLLDKGGDVNARITREPNQLWVGRAPMSKIGATPFFLAAHKFDVELMKYLLTRGANPLLPNKDGTTPLMVAAGIGIMRLGENPGTWDEIAEATRLCLELGGDATAVNADGDTALHGAAFSGSNGAVQALVEAGGKLDVRNGQNWSPLRIAVGVDLNNSFNSQPHTADLLRQLMEAKGIPIKAEETSALESAKAVKPKQ